MYKLLFIFFMFVSSPLYSNEFKYHCDSDDKLTSFVFEINKSKKSIVFTHMIFPPIFEDGKNEVDEVYEKLYVQHWDIKNDSVWTITYNETNIRYKVMTMMLFNFGRQRLYIKSMTNDLSEYQNNNDYSENDGYDIFDCSILK